MEFVVILKYGFGNKLFILANMLQQNPKATLHILDATSEHQEGDLKEKIWNLFPLLKKHPRIYFIRWSEYDELKRIMPELKYDFDIFFTNFKKKVSPLKEYLIPNYEYDYLKNKYDFTQGIFVHYRLGDKVKINYDHLKKGNPIHFVVMKPEYYLDSIKKFQKNNEPVYVFSDSPELVKCLLKGNFTFVDENVNETFFCFYYANRVIISDSSLSVTAVTLGPKKHIIVPRYIVSSLYDEKPLQLIENPNFSYGEMNQSYILKTLDEYDKIIKICRKERKHGITMTLKEWINLPKTMELIVQASTRDGRDGLTEYPIGMGYGFLKNQTSALEIKEKTKLNLVAFNETTDSKRRKGKLTRLEFSRTLESNGFQNEELSNEEYFKTIGEHKFVTSPEGNGLDCHRHYEALLAGSIPIIERNPSIQEKYDKLPVLWTTNYSEITGTYLNEKYEKMLDKKYDFSALYFDSYNKEMQDLIKLRSKYWLKRLLQDQYYQIVTLGEKEIKN
jgi:hypothetical protein